MTGHPIRRALVLLAAATLTAALATGELATGVEAAKPKPKCQGFTATIVGTQKGEVIRGTARRDIIVAKGGADRIYGRGGNDLICAGTGNDVVYGGPGADVIWGQLGRDRLYGNAGPDFVAGQVGNDMLNGGIGVDTCFQGTGSGPVLRCERPTPPASPPPPPLDTDGDGIPDVSDACPNRGDQGWGLDVDGCPYPSVTVTYFSTTVGNFQWVTTWKGTEPGSLVRVRLTCSVVPCGSADHTPSYYGNSTGSGSMATAFSPDLACSRGFDTAEITATEAGGTEKTFPGPLPDSSVCP
jgi:hypothetical protein